MNKESRTARKVAKRNRNARNHKLLKRRQDALSFEETKSELEKAQEQIAE